MAPTRSSSTSRCLSSRRRWPPASRRWSPCRSGTSENLHAALGGTPTGVTLFSVEQWHETSARTRDKFGRWVAEHAGSRGRVRVIGEPPWAIGHEAQVRDWARHEAVLNVAFAEYPVSFICPYDATVLPPEIIEHAAQHPSRDRRPVGYTSRSEAYEDPLEFCRRLDSCGRPGRRRPGSDDRASVLRTSPTCAASSATWP